MAPCLMARVMENANEFKVETHRLVSRRSEAGTRWALQAQVSRWAEPVLLVERKLVRLWQVLPRILLSRRRCARRSKSPMVRGGEMNEIKDASAFAIYVIIVLALAFIFTGDPDLRDIALQTAKTGACK